MGCKIFDEPLITKSMIADIRSQLKLFSLSRIQFLIKIIENIGQIISCDGEVWFKKIEISIVTINASNDFDILLL